MLRESNHWIYKLLQTWLGEFVPFLCRSFSVRYIYYNLNNHLFDNYEGGYVSCYKDLHRLFLHY